MYLNLYHYRLIFIFLMVSMSSLGLGQTALNQANGRVLFKNKEGKSVSILERKAQEFGAHQVRAYSLVPGLFLYQLANPNDMPKFMASIKSSGLVEYVEEDFSLNPAAQNDTRYGEEWALENTGQTGGTVDADINAEPMWAIEDGDSSVVIGTIDSGIDYTHNDLIPNLWVNSQEIPSNGIDDDGNGYVDDIYGINSILNNGNPADDNGHGTFAAGIIGAEGNNALGVVGVAQNVQIASCKSISASGQGNISDVIQCMQYFANLKNRAVNPVNIVATSNAWTSSTLSSSALLDAIKAHDSLGIIFVAAAGNAGKNNDVAGSVPGNIQQANIISVTATDDTDAVPSFANYGQRLVHVAAPGDSILSTLPGQAYGTKSGTSAAVAHVAGLIAIIKSAFPLYTHYQIKNLVISSGTPLANLDTITVSGRRIRGADSNDQGALTCVDQIVDRRTFPFAQNITISLGESIFLEALRINCDQPIGPLQLYSLGLESVVLQDSGTNGDRTANDGRFSLLWQPQMAGTYNLDFGNGDIVNVEVSSLPASYKAFNITAGYSVISGTSLGVSDESIHTVVTPFPIHFNDDPAGFQTMYVSSNGTISFTDTLNPGYQNTELSDAIEETLIAPFWDDLRPSSSTGSDIFVATLGTTPNRLFVVEWRNVRHYNTEGTGRFQVVFYESSPSIRFNYNDTDFGDNKFNFGASATVGVKSDLLTTAQYSFNFPTLPAPFSLYFKLD